jgi:hypothetical protein
MAHYEANGNDKYLLHRPCHHKQFGDNASFALYPISRDHAIEERLTSLSLTVTSSGDNEEKEMKSEGEVGNMANSGAGGNKKGLVGREIN